MSSHRCDPIKWSRLYMYAFSNILPNLTTVDSPIPPKRTSSKFKGTPHTNLDSPETSPDDDSPLEIIGPPTITEKTSVPTESFASETQEARQRVVKPNTNPELPVAEPQPQNNTFKIAIAVIILASLLLIYIAFF